MVVEEVDMGVGAEVEEEGDSTIEAIHKMAAPQL